MVNFKTSHKSHTQRQRQRRRPQQQRQMRKQRQRQRRLAFVASIQIHRHGKFLCALSLSLSLPLPISLSSTVIFCSLFWAASQVAVRSCARRALLGRSACCILCAVVNMRRRVKLCGTCLLLLILLSSGGVCVCVCVCKRVCMCVVIVRRLFCFVFLRSVAHSLTLSRSMLRESQSPRLTFYNTVKSALCSRI